MTTELTLFGMVITDLVWALVELQDDDQRDSFWMPESFRQVNSYAKKLQFEWT